MNRFRIIPIWIALALASNTVAGEWDGKQSGKAGLYLRLAQKDRTTRADFFLSHPLVDALFGSFAWADLEPVPGEYDFSQIDEALRICRKHGKGLVLAISTYGQHVERQPTPEWLYGKGVKAIRFHGGGVAKGDMITVPKVWDETYLREYAKLIRELGKRYNREKSIWYVMPGLGHIGNVNAQPSKNGGPAFLAEGWTPEIWTQFCKDVADLYQPAFPDIPLIVKSANQFLKNKEHNHYYEKANELLAELAKRRVSVIGFGLEADIEKIRRNNAVERIANLSEYTLSGNVRLGLGDDWPLWIPEKRRIKNGKFLADRDEAGLGRELQYAFGGVEELPKTHISILYVLQTEMEACHPDNPDGQNKWLYELLAAARNRLKQEEPIP
jgi:hypothetical protein